MVWVAEQVEEGRRVPCRRRIQDRRCSGEGVGGPGVLVLLAGAAFKVHLKVLAVIGDPDISQCIMRKIV